MNSAELERLEFRGVARRTNAAVAITWVSLWIGATAVTRALGGGWYGVAWGFVLGGALSGLGTWLFYVRPARRRRIAATARWADGAIAIAEAASGAVTRIALDRPHRALLIAAKGEGRAALRLEQVDAAGGTGARAELFGPLPTVLPIRIAGETTSLAAVEARGRQRRRDAAPAYRLGAPDAVAREQMTALLAFIERHRAQRVDRLAVPFARGVLRLGWEGIELEVGGETIAFGKADAASLRAAAEVAAQAIPLEPETVESVVVAHSIRRVLRRRLPDHPLVESLRR